MALAKGSTLRATMEFVRADKGAEALERVLARLPGERRAQVEHEHLPHERREPARAAAQDLAAARDEALLAPVAGEEAGRQRAGEVGPHQVWLVGCGSAARPVPSCAR